MTDVNKKVDEVKESLGDLPFILCVMDRENDTIRCLVNGANQGDMLVFIKKLIEVGNLELNALMQASRRVWVEEAKKN